MENNNIHMDTSRLIGVATGAAFSVMWIAFSTIGTEVSAPFKTLLKNTFTHHWIGKGVVAIIIFLATAFVATLIARRISSTNTTLALRVMFYASLFGVIAIVGLYGYLDFLK